MAVFRRTTSEVMSDELRQRLEALVSSSARPRRGDPTPGPPPTAAPAALIEEKGAGRGWVRPGPDPDQTVVRPVRRIAPERSPQNPTVTQDPRDSTGAAAVVAGAERPGPGRAPRPAPGPEPADGPPIHQSPGATAPRQALEFGRRHLQVIGALLALGVLLGGFALTRARSHPVAPPAVAAIPAAPAAASASPTATPEVMVHVLGAVNRPGVYRLPAGARVVDAVDAAGGLTPQARPGELNFAQPLEDGQQVLVGSTDNPGGQVRTDGGGDAGGTASTTSEGTGAKPSGGKVNLNKATVDQLDALPGIGPVTAGKIIAWREQNQKFTRIEELQEVPGIGPKSYAELAPLVTV